MTTPRTYAIPVLGRYGLTHGMLAWGRCCVWCEQNGATMLAPFWLKIRPGPYLRGDRDKRNYFLLFNHGSAVGGLSRLGVLARVRKVDIATEWPEAPAEQSGPVVLRFHNAVVDNEKKSFAQVVGHGPFLRRELLAMTRSRYQPAPHNEPFIAIHVRLGDFRHSNATIAATGMTNRRLPIDWYGDRLDALRAALGQNVRTLVFSDGEDSELAALLARDNVARVPKQESVTDLLEMGMGVAVIASGSGFSLWGAFLGSAPRIAFPAQSIVPIDLDPTRDIESDFGDAIDASFVDHVRARF